MLALLKNLVAGNESRNVVQLKHGAGIITAVSTLYWCATAFGFDPGWNDSQVSAVGAAVASIWTLYSIYASSKRVGFRPRRRDVDEDNDDDDYDGDRSPFDNPFLRGEK